MEAWSLGDDGDGYYVSSFASGNPGACFEDDYSRTGRNALGASNDEVIILDRNLVKVKTHDVGSYPLTYTSNRNSIKDFVDTLL